MGAPQGPPAGSFLQTSDLLPWAARAEKGLLESAFAGKGGRGRALDVKSTYWLCASGSVPAHLSGAIEDIWAAGGIRPGEDAQNTA